MKSTAAMRILPILLAVSFPLAAAGCADGGGPGEIERPPTMERPNPANHATAPVGPITLGTTDSDRVLAEVSGVRVLESQLMPILVEAYGLDVLLKVVQLNMAKSEAARDGLTVSPADVERERQTTMEYAFPGQDPADFPQLMKQLLQRQHVSDVEFGLVLQTNAYLRVLVKPLVSGQITEEMVRNEFNANYGERVRVRHIALNNMQEVAEARARLASGAPFEQVAQQMSKYPTTARLGGELPPFSRMTPGVGDAFSKAAFAMTQVGEVSPDTVDDGAFKHILKLEERIAPRAVKYEDVQDSVRSGLMQRLEQVAMGRLRDEMAERARRDLQINEPTLKRQFEERISAANPNVPTDNNAENRRLDQKLEKTREMIANPNGTTQPTTAPATTEPAIMNP